MMSCGEQTEYTDSLAQLPYEAFRKNYDNFFSSGVDPSILARKLFSEKFISESVHKDVTDPHIGWGADRKLQHLLKPCMDAIKFDGKYLFKFLSILRTIGVITAEKLAENIMRDYLGIDVPNWYIPPDTQLLSLPPYVVTMPNFSTHKNNKVDWHSPPFYSEIGGYRLQLHVIANGYGDGTDTDISVGICLLNGENDENLDWPMNCEITVQLLNWMEDNRHVEKIIDHYNVPISGRSVVLGDAPDGTCVVFQFISHEELNENPAKNTKFIHNDALCFRILKVNWLTELDVPEWYDPPKIHESLTPPCTITMSNYSEHKRVSNQWRSPPFYSKPNGYKLQLLVDANGAGNGKGTHVSVYVHLMKGEYDSKLKWPFDSEFTVKLLNWKEDEGHVERQFDAGTIEHHSRVTLEGTATSGLGYHQFVSHSDLTDKFINNDALCFFVPKFKKN